MKTATVQASQPAPLLNGPYLMRPEEYYMRVGRGAQTCRDEEKAGRMPRRIFLTPTTVRWNSEEVFAWLGNVFAHGARTPEEAAEMRKAANEGGGA